HTPSPSSHWRATVAALLLPLLLAACGRDTETPVRPLQAQPWTLPAPPGAAQPDLVRAPDGRLLLSWLEPAGDGHRLRLASTRPGRRLVVGALVAQYRSVAHGLRHRAGALRRRRPQLDAGRRGASGRQPRRPRLRQLLGTGPGPAWHRLAGQPAEGGRGRRRTRRP